jgi:hypothetical protein
MSLPLFLLLVSTPSRSTSGAYSSNASSQEKREVPPDDKAPAPVTASPTDAGPALTQAAIVSILRSRRDDIQRCYEAELSKHPGLAGHVLVQFTILPTGEVSGLTTKETTLGSPAVEGCLLRLVSGIVFLPKPWNPVGLVYGWTFGVTPGAKK